MVYLFIGDRAQPGQRLGDVSWSIRRLTQELLDVGLQAQRAVDLRIRARNVRTNVDQIAGLLIGKHRVSDHRAHGQVIGGRQCAEQTADTLQHVDGWIVVLLGQRSRKNDVAVQDAAHRVGDRVLHVVAFGEHGVQTGDTAAVGHASPLQQPRQHREHRRWIPTRDRRLAYGESNFALGHGEASDRVHHQRDVLAAGTKVFGNRGGNPGALQSLQRRLVRGRDHNHRAGQPISSEVVCDELLDLAATLTNQGDDVDVGFTVAGDHAQQRALADA
jgi:hypothetical protein